MHGQRKPSLLDRLAGAARGREVKVLVLVNTTRGQVAVPVSKKKLLGR
jgi:hypothetical protein